jgi:hypothetical protein
MRVFATAVIPALIIVAAPATFSQTTPRTLVAVWAHADDETVVGPVLARNDLL